MFMDRMELKGLYWQYSNGTRVPVVDREEPSDVDVYVERYAGSQVPAQNLEESSSFHYSTTFCWELYLCRQVQPDVEESKRGSSSYRWAIVSRASPFCH